MDQKVENQHIVGYSTYVLVWIGLIVLTGITVTIAGMNLGRISIVVALIIASIKSGLVLWYFMHLKYEEGLFRVILLVAIATITVIIGFTFIDIVFR